MPIAQICHTLEFTHKRLTIHKSHFIGGKIGSKFFIAVALLMEFDVESCGRTNTTDLTGIRCIPSTSSSTKLFGALVRFLKNLTYNSRSSFSSSTTSTKCTFLFCFINKQYKIPLLVFTKRALKFFICVLIPKRTNGK